MTPETRRAGLAIAGAITIGLSLVGFMRATSSDDYVFEAPLREITGVPVAGETRPSRTYWQLRDVARGEAVLPESLALLQAAVPSVTDALELSDVSRADALTARTHRRAFYGAPPVIPHPVNQSSMSECLACHDHGMRMGALAAPAIPHPAFLSCTQCHALAEPNLPWGERSEGLAEDPRAVPNSFVGLKAPLMGNRWTSVAPPIVPHDSFMHERCVSCHGPNGRVPLRTPHPDRSNCRQCHALNANLEQRPGGRL